MNFFKLVKKFILLSFDQDKPNSVNRFNYIKIIMITHLEIDTNNLYCHIVVLSILNYNINSIIIN
jgi:hypothetical protein